MSVVFILTLKAAEGRYEQLAATMKAILPDTASRPGAELIRAAGSPAAGTVTVYEVWDRVESQEAYRLWREERGDLGVLADMLGEPPKFEQMDILL